MRIFVSRWENSRRALEESTLRIKMDSEIRHDLKIWDLENPLFDHKRIIRAVCGFVVSSFVVGVYASFRFDQTPSGRGRGRHH
jgi:hypothetical protein